MASWLLSVLTLLIAVATLLPIWRHEAWWVRGLDFPRVQLFSLSLILLVADFTVLDRSLPSTWGLLAVGALCSAYQAWWIVPYTRLYPVEVQPAKKKNADQSLRILTANVLMPNRNAVALIQLVNETRPHIVLTLESDSWWESQLQKLEAEYPYTIQCPLDNLYGMHVYSKLKLLDARTEFLVEPEVPSMHALAVLPTGHRIRLHFLHPAPPSPTENEESSERDAELVLVAKSINGSAEPVIVTGDLNDVAWSATTRLFRKISGLLDPRVGRGMFNTFHASYGFLRWPLDHLFHSDHFTVSSIRRLRSFGSDHFPLFTELVFEAGRRNEQNGLTADSDDRAWADEKVENEGSPKRTNFVSSRFR